MAKLVTTTDLSRIVGKSQPYITKLRKQGKLNSCMEKKGTRYFFDVKKAVDIIGGHKIEKPGTTALTAEEVEGLSYNEAVRREKAYKAALKKLEYLEAKDKLVSKKAVMDDGVEFGQLIKNTFSKIPVRTAPLLVGKTDIFEIQTILKTAIYESLTSCAIEN